MPSLQTTSAKKASEVYRCRFVGGLLVDREALGRDRWIISKFSNYAEKGLVGDTCVARG